LIFDDFTAASDLSCSFEVRSLVLFFLQNTLYCVADERNLICSPKKAQLYIY